MAQQCSQDQKLVEEINWLMIATAEYRKQLKDTNLGICAVRKEMELLSSVGFGPPRIGPELQIR